MTNGTPPPPPVPPLSRETIIHEIEVDSIEEAIARLEALLKDGDSPSLFQAMASASLRVQVGKVVITITIST